MKLQKEIEKLTAEGIWTRQQMDSLNSNIEDTFKPLVE